MTYILKMFNSVVFTSKYMQENNSQEKEMKSILSTAIATHVCFLTLANSQEPRKYDGLNLNDVTQSLTGLTHFLSIVWYSINSQLFFDFPVPKMPKSLFYKDVVFAQK